MGLDLTLISISNKAEFVLEKAKQNIKYAADLDKIQDAERLRLHLKMAKAAADDSSKSVLQELIEDSERVLHFYPNKETENYVFHSRTRGYETLNYLLIHYLKSNRIKDVLENSKIFYGGTDIQSEFQFSRFQYLSNEQVSEICDLLESIAFSQLLEYYDFNTMVNVVYKLTRPENLKYLEEEFEQLKVFYKNAKNLEAFVLIKIN